MFFVVYDYYRQEKQQVKLYDSLAELVDSVAETEEGAKDALTKAMAG